MAGSTETPRSGQQGQSLAALLARFTADRDSLIAAIEACQERLARLVERVEGNAPDDSIPRPIPLLPAALPARTPQVDELRAGLTQLRLDQDNAIAQVLARADQAAVRAEEALRRVKEMEMRLEELAVAVRRRRSAEAGIE